MKHTIRTIIVAVVLMAVAFPACQKYDEGPFLSLASAKSRVVNSWKMQTVYSNGSDVTAYWTLLWPSFNYELKNDDTYILTWSSALVESGTWTFDNPKEKIITTATGSLTSTTYTITKLKKDEMWVTYTEAIGGTNWEYHLVTK
jgi:hypothetical protein